MTETQQLQRKLMLNAAVLIAIGLLTGVLLASAMTGKLNADPKIVLSAHLNALLGCFWMAAVAFSLPLTRYSVRGQHRLLWLVTIPNYGNWAITLFKSFWKVAGVDTNGDAHNDTIFGLLTALVVLPSFAAAVGWIYGLIPKRS